MKYYRCEFEGNQALEALVAETWREWFCFWLLALLQPSCYRLGSCGKESCVFYERSTQRT